MAAIANLTIQQGATFSSDVTVTTDAGAVFDLTGHNSFGQLSKGFASTQDRTTFTTSNNTASGVITISLTAAQTAALEEGRYVYDVTIVKTSDSTVTRVVEGIATVFPRVASNY
jgi:hypothetical protein